MNPTSLAPLCLITTLVVAACSGGAADPGMTGAADGGAGGTTGLAGTGAAGTGPLSSPLSWIPSAMPLISRGVPAFASGSAHAGVAPGKSNDADRGSTWFPDKLPAWIAYDLSGVPAAQRQQILIAFYCPHAGDYLLDEKATSAGMPLDYTLEVNGAPGGAAPPTAAWKTVATELGNTRAARQHLVDLAGGNWVRMTVTRATDPKGASFDLDVHSAPDGASDSWLMMGDSITHISTMYAFSDLPARVHERDAARWPAVVHAAIGGTNTTTALAALDETMRLFPGRFVWLAYGTNDHANELKMEALVQKVLAAGKIPAIPHIPWSSAAGIQAEAPIMNQAIDALYAKYPQIFRGPDLWAAFKDRTDLIPTGDVHPNGMGQAELLRQWAIAMTK